MTIFSFPARTARFAVAAAFLILALVVPAVESEAKKPPRRGGKVEVAWPKSKRGKPSQALAKYLARQVGALKPPSLAGDRAVTRAPRQTGVGGTSGTASVSGGGNLPTPLRLVRSFDIPRADPAYDRLLNISFTYDSALAAAAFSATDDKTQAGQLLDQLKALQRTDGSIDYAFDTLTGASDAHFWTGTIAWTGYAAELYHEEFNSSKYSQVANGAKTWLVSQQLPNGLIKGGPSVSWASTLHNIIAWNFLTAYAANRGNSSKARGEAQAAATKIQSGIESLLLVSDSSGTRFRQGLDDSLAALDAQTMGIMYLLARGRFTDAGRVADYVQANFGVSNRTIVKSSDPATFNETYASNGPFSGFRPYAGPADVPDLIWMEGTLQAKLALTLLGRSTSSLDQSITRWNAVTGKSVAPLMANKTETSRFNEYHVWPVSSTASWTLLNAAFLDDDDD